MINMIVHYKTNAGQKGQLELKDRSFDIWLLVHYFCVLDVTLHKFYLREIMSE